MRAEASFSAKPNSTLDARITVLETNQAGLITRLGAYERETTRRLYDLETTIAQEKASHIAAEGHSRTALEAMALGAIHWTLVGVLFLSLGLIMGTVSADLVRYRWLGPSISIVWAILGFLFAHPEEVGDNAQRGPSP